MRVKKWIGNYALEADHLGPIAFIYIIIYAVIKLKIEHDLMTILLLTIGIFGLLVDGSLLSLHYLKK